MVLAIDQSGKQIFDKVVIVDHNRDAVKNQVEMKRIYFFDKNSDQIKQL